MVIDAGELYVFVREAREMIRSLFGIDPARLHLLYQSLYSISGHPLILAQRAGRSRFLTTAVFGG
jgi:hypothetical protein